MRAQETKKWRAIEERCRSLFYNEKLQKIKTTVEPETDPYRSFVRSFVCQFVGRLLSSYCPCFFLVLTFQRELQSLFKTFPMMVVFFFLFNVTREMGKTKRVKR